MGWACMGYADEVGECFHIVGEGQLFADLDDTAQGAPVVYCKKHEAAARADGVRLVPLAEVAAN